MAEQKCKCGHSRENHSVRGGFQFCEGTTMAVCPCGLYEPATPSGEVAQGEGSILRDEKTRCACGHLGWVHGLSGCQEVGCICRRSISGLAAQPEPYLAGTELELVSRLRQEAQMWAQEARTHKNSLLECYAAVGVHGKADFNGAEPVRQAYAALKQSHTQSVDALMAFNEVGNCKAFRDMKDAALETAAALGPK